MGTHIHTRNYECNQTIYNVNKPFLSFRLDEPSLHIYELLNRNVLTLHTHLHIRSHIMKKKFRFIVIFIVIRELSAHMSLFN